METTFLNGDCPVCLLQLNNINNIHLTPCLHRIHLECLSGMTTLNCPLCRQPVDNYPLHISNKILDNKRKYEQQLDNEALEELHRQETEFLLNNNVESHLEKNMRTARKEAMLAVAYLYENGIPFQFIPVNITIMVTDKHSYSDFGMVFFAIIDKILNKINIEEENDNIEEDEDNDNPFFSSNYRLGTTNRIIKIGNYNKEELL